MSRVKNHKIYNFPTWYLGWQENLTETSNSLQTRKLKAETVFRNPKVTFSFPYNPRPSQQATGNNWILRKITNTSIPYNKQNLKFKKKYFYIRNNFKRKRQKICQFQPSSKPTIMRNTNKFVKPLKSWTISE